jgi:hypothetical protein
VPKATPQLLCQYRSQRQAPPAHWI